MGARVTKVAATSQPSDPVKALRAAEPGTTTEGLHTNAAQITVHPLHLARLNVSVPSPAIDSVDSPDSKSPSHDALQSDSHHQQFSTSSPAYQPSSLLSRTPQPVGYYELQPYSTFHSTMPQQTPRYETSAVQSALTPSAAAHSQRSSHYWASGTTTGDAKTTAVHNAPAPNHRVHLPPLSMPPTFPAPSSSSILPAPSARSGRAHAPSVPPHSTALTCTPLAGAVKGGQAALAPVDEEARVRALMSYRVLDTLPEEPFNQLAFLVTQICATPIALVSFVSTDRQWFKANIGFDAAETPRDVAFCAHAILHRDSVFVVADASRDVRFADNPMVVGAPNIRFYAGAPLVTHEGHALGSICALDRQPRLLTDEQRRSMQALASAVVAQLELRSRTERLTHALAQLHSSKAQLHASQQTSEGTERDAVTECSG